MLTNSARTESISSAAYTVYEGNYDYKTSVYDRVYDIALSSQGDHYVSETHNIKYDITPPTITNISTQYQELDGTVVVGGEEFDVEGYIPRSIRPFILALTRTRPECGCAGMATGKKSRAFKMGVLFLFGLQRNLNSKYSQL